MFYNFGIIIVFESIYGVPAYAPIGAYGLAARLCADWRIRRAILRCGDIDMSDWKIGDKRLLLHTPIWDVFETEKETPDGKSARFVSLKAPNWCTAVVRHADTGEFVMIREYRHGLNAWVYEFPCGTVEAGENPEDGILREVREETGYQDAEIVRKLFTGCPNPAFMNNSMNGYYIEVRGARSVQHLDNTEFIQVISVKDPEEFFDERSSTAILLAWERYKVLNH